MNLYRILIFFSLTCSINAGPVIVAGVRALITIGAEAAAATVAGSAIASACGVGASGVWFGAAVIIDGALYTGSQVAVAGALAAAGGAAGGSVAIASAVKVGDLKEITTDAAALASISSEIAKNSSISVSKASVHSVSYQSALSKMITEATSIAAKQSALKESQRQSAQSAGASRVSSRLSSQAMASMNAWLKTATEKMTWSINTMLPTKTTAKGSVPSALANLPPDYAQYAPGVPPGVPKHDMVNCQMAIVEMGKQGKPLLVDAPENKHLRVDNIPPQCMALSAVLHGDPVLGPHPIPQGSASLQWNNVSPEFISLLRLGLGMTPF